MPDREKVKAELDEIVEQCRGMDYIGFSTITEHCQNILALLKEQEAVEPNSVEKNSIFSYGVCPSCGKNIDTIFNPVACGYCGRSVKWE